MCGIAGYVSTDEATDRGPILGQLTGALHHRGPDDDGFFTAPGVGLGMRRLSIVDLAGSCQPIANEDGTIQLVFNGEIYNYLELRADLEKRGHRLSTHGDAETLIHLYEDRGVEALRFLRGMFAFALWDSRKKLLFLARDRLGKKPLNYVCTADTLYFCSEIAPLLDAKLAPWEIDPGALGAYLMFGYVSAPRSLVRQIQKLPPAHYLTWQRGNVSVQRYWSLEQQPKLRITYAEAREQVRAKLDESLRLRLRSDVPLGLLLSGGVDSNALLARLVKGLGQRVHAFTIGFAEKEYDESDLARISAQHFGVEHHVLQADTDLLQLMPDAVRHYGEPSADKSILPTLMVCALTRQQVKVALSGDGGDEAFAGYSKHRLKAWQPRGLLPRKLSAQWTWAAMRGETSLGRWLRRRLLPEAPSLFSGEFFTGKFWRQLTTENLRRAAESSLRAHLANFWSGERDPLDRILHWDTTDPLPNSLLTKLDIASMARSLEVRSPFLDHELLELCARLPNEWKVNTKQGKLILRDLVADDLPPEIIRARKRGFSVPLAQWWRGQAKQQIRDGLLPLHPVLRPFIEEKMVAKLVEDHQAGRANHAQRLWNLWMLNAWTRMFLS